MSEAEKKEPVQEEEHDALMEPPNITAPSGHRLWPLIKAAIREIYDPEIPVNVYELGLIYTVEIKDRDDGKSDVSILMTLTSPGCPVAQDMPGWIQGAVFDVEGIEHVDVEIVWEPQWNPSMMAETAKMQLNMFM